MSVHKIPLDVQEVAKAIESIKRELELVEFLIQQALLGEIEDERANVTTNQQS